MRGNTRFVLISAVLFLVGGWLRVASGGLSLPSFNFGTGLTPPFVSSRPAPVEVGATVLDFYAAVDKGRYADAYAMALENRWSPGADGAPEVAGLATEAEFVDSLARELGANGMGLNIIAIQALEEVRLSAEEKAPEFYPELLTLESLPAGQRVKHVYRVHVAGTLLGRCSRWDWSKHILVAEVQGGGWRVLLPGVQAPYQPHYEEWFLDRSL
jgi:hypothetical protein